METVSGFDPNKQSHDTRAEQAKPEPVYKYLHGCQDFSDVIENFGFNPQEITLRSYGDNAEAYSAIEWSEQLIEAVWQAHKEAFKLVQELKPGDDGFVHVLVGGEGTGRDLIYFVLLISLQKWWVMTRHLRWC
jgi:hypothetical protein